MRAYISGIADLSRTAGADINPLLVLIWKFGLQLIDGPVDLR
jgi:hypothetical protein